MADEIIKKKIKAGGGNSSVTRSTMADRMKEVKTRPVKSQGVSAAESAKPPAQKHAPPKPKGIPAGGGNSSVTRTTRPQGSWSEKAREATGRGKTFSSVPNSSAPKSGVGGTLLRGLGRVAGPVGALVAMTKPAGAGSDKPSGPLMKGTPKGRLRPEVKRAEQKDTKETKVAVLGGSGIGGYGRNKDNTYQLGGNKQERRYFDGNSAAPKPTAKPVKAGKSKTRAAFEKEFAKNRKSGKKEFTFRGKRYNTKIK